MDTKIKTIFGSKRNISLWLGALYSGDYTQGRHSLFNDAIGGYCCLGVLQKKLDGKVETRGRDKIPGNYPSKEWLHEHVIRFVHLNLDGKVHNNCADRPSVYLTDEHTHKLSEHLNSGYYNVDVLNDSNKFSFEEIANLIANHVEYTD